MVKVREIFDALVDMPDVHDRGKLVFDSAVGGDDEAKDKNTAVRRVINSSRLAVVGRNFQDVIKQAGSLASW